MFSGSLAREGNVMSAFGTKRKSADRVTRSGSGRKADIRLQCRLMNPTDISGTPPGRPVDTGPSQTRRPADKMLHPRSSSVLVSFNLVYQLVTKDQYAILRTTKDAFEQFEIVGQEF